MKALSIVALALLALAIPFDIVHSEIPFWKFVGLDFQNLWAFHHCELRNAPYARADAGAVCGDAEQRNMKYPPLFYWSFAWTRPLSFDAALRVWLAVIAILMALSLRAWSASPLLIALLFVQFPMLFAFERGNTDAAVVALWTASFLLYRRGRDTAAGALAGLAAAFKIYPAFALLVVVFTMRRRAVPFLLGAAASGAAASIVFGRQTLQYLHVALAYAGERPLRSVFSHPVGTYYPMPWLWIALLLGAWAAAAWRIDDDLAFAGALAISTFAIPTSWDYNLICAYPLIAVLFARRDIRHGVALLLLLLTLTLPRVFFIHLVQARVALQLIALVATAALAARSATLPTPAPPRPR